jgi:hypothetical protein
LSKWKVLPQLKEGARISGEGRQIVDEHGSVIALVYAAGRNDREGERIAYEMATARTTLASLEECHKVLSQFAQNVNKFSTVENIVAFNGTMTRAKTAILEAKGDHGMPAPEKAPVPKANDKTPWGMDDDEEDEPDMPFYSSPAKPPVLKGHNPSSATVHLCKSSKACQTNDPYICSELRSGGAYRKGKCLCGCHQRPKTAKY